MFSGAIDVSSFASVAGVPKAPPQEFRKIYACGTLCRHSGQPRGTNGLSLEGPPRHPDETMQITGFRTIRAHGHLNLDVALNPDLTFLTGINGSGKTTAVRGMIALLTPSLRDLSGIGFSRMEVSGRNNDEEFQVWATRTEEEITIGVNSLEPFVTPILKSEPYETNSRFNDKVEFYREQLGRAIAARNPSAFFLAALPTPMFLDLERRGGVPRRRYPTNEIHASSSPFVGSLGEGLREAQDLADETNRSYLVLHGQLTQELRKGLILMAFAHDRDAEGIPDPTDEFEPKNLDRTYQAVTAVLNSLGISDEEVKRQVEPFFTAYREATTQIEGMNDKDPAFLRALSNWYSLEPQARYIQRMVRRAEQFSQRVAAEHAPIANYLGTVNSFLMDSGKRLEFSPRGRLRVMLGERPLGSLSALSSGERQLVVILTHLSFNELSQTANVLIIDEPELSLHIKWQELFVEALRSAGRNIQLILATHSPSIIMDRTDYCVDLQDRRRD